MAIKVRAIKTGYYGLELRTEGKEFEIASKSEFSENWMEYVEEPLFRSRKGKDADEA